MKKQEHHNLNLTTHTADDLRIVIPARYNATRFPGKLLQKLSGKEIILRVIDQIININIPIIVATDDERIFACVENHIANSSLKNLSVEYTSKDCISGTERVAEIASRNHHIDIWINVQADEPFVNPQDIQSLISIMTANSNVMMATMCAKISDIEKWNNNNIVKVILNQKREAIYFSRSKIPFNRKDDTIPSCAFQHIGVYAYKREALFKLVNTSEAELESFESLEQLRAVFIGIPITVIEVNEALFGIDTYQDLIRADKIISENKHI